MMITVDKRMVWLADAFFLLALPRKKHSKKSDRLYYAAFVLLCIGYSTGDNSWILPGLMIAAVSFSSPISNTKK